MVRQHFKQLMMKLLKTIESHCFIAIKNGRTEKNGEIKCDIHTQRIRYLREIRHANGLSH